MFWTVTVVALSLTYLQGMSQQLPRCCPGLAGPAQLEMNALSVNVMFVFCPSGSALPAQ